jgi:hypothetical protein
MLFLPLVFLGLLPGTLAAFGVTKGSNYLDVDTGNKLVYRGTPITSILLGWAECSL